MKPYVKDAEKAKMEKWTRMTFVAFAVVIALQFVLPQKCAPEPLLWPLVATGGVQYKSSGYGVRANPLGGGGGSFHSGLDLACRKGTGVVAVDSGIILVCATKDPTFGTYIILRLDRGLDILYGHLSETWYARGKRVQRGWVIGLSGNTGLSTGPHLHLQVLQDPLELFKPDKAWEGRN